MGHPIAVAFLHGIGRTEPGYSEPLARTIGERFAGLLGRDAADPSTEIVFEEVNWSAVLQSEEDRLWSRLAPAAPMRYERLRHFMLDFAADAIAYQPTQSDRSAYDAIHQEIAVSLSRLAARAGARAPLCVVAHSLGSVIASNYFYDLMKPRRSFLAPEVRAQMGTAPLEKGETLALLVTMGSPIALWSLRYPGFGEPLRLPVERLERHHPKLQAKWINLYDPDDVIGYPLRPVSPRYAEAVTEDLAVDVGTLLTRWNPLAHTGYWNNAGVARRIAEHAAEAWRQSSAVAMVPARRRSAARRVSGASSR